MSFVGPGDVVTYLVWLEQVQKLGLGDTSTPDIDERKTKKEDGEYTIYFWNGSEYIKANRDADLLAGQPGSYYQDASNLNAGTINLARIPAILTGKSADKLDGQEGSYYRNASNLNAGTIALARIPPLLTGKDVDKLDGQEGSYYLNAGNLNAGTINLARIPATLTGKSADKLDGQEGSFYQNASNLNSGTLLRDRLGALWLDNETGEYQRPFIQTGRKTCAVADTFYQVTFYQAFTSTPKITFGDEWDTNSLNSIRSRIITTTGFQVSVNAAGGTVNWVTIGRKD